MTNKKDDLILHPYLFMLILFFSGIFLFIHYEPSLYEANESITYLASNVTSGNIIRSVHRYTADAILIIVFLHTFRVHFTNNYKDNKINAWYYGIVSLGMTFIVGISGYILPWDERSHQIILRLSEFLAYLPIIGQSLAHAFINDDVVSNYTMSMAFFLHTGISFSLLVMLWVHYMRISRPVLNIKWNISFLIFGLILIISDLFPAISGPKANLTINSKYFDIDSLYLLIFLVMKILGNGLTWILVLAGAIFFIFLSFTIKTSEFDLVELSVSKRGDR